ncbi:MAG: cytochrome c [Actinobacteria bacterium]|nr:cytochrome c [Actinomycetota bacterium]
MRRTAHLVLVASAVVAGAACGSDPGDSPGAAPPDGSALYSANCAACHGTDLRGTLSGPSFLDPVYEPASTPDQSFRAAVDHGVLQKRWNFGAMAPVAGLDDDEVTAIIAFIRAGQQD